MDESEQTQRELRKDVDQLKEQMARVLEVIQSLEEEKNTNGNPSAVNNEQLHVSSHSPCFSSIPLQYGFTPQGVIVPLTMYPHSSTQPPVTNPQDTQTPPVPPYGLPFGYIPSHTTNHQKFNVPVVTPKSNPQNTTYPQPHHPRVSYHSPPLSQMQSPSVILPPPNQQGNQSSRVNQRKLPSGKGRKQVQFDSIPMSYADLLSYLIPKSLVVPCPMKPVEPPFPKGYDPNAKCEYHAGVVGHSTENCRALKFRVQDLIKARWLSFNEGGPIVGNNLPSSHGRPSTDAIEGSSSMVCDRAFEP